MKHWKATLTRPQAVALLDSWLTSKTISKVQYDTILGIHDTFKQDSIKKPQIDSSLLQTLDTTGSIAGTVVDTAGSHLSGVSVQLNGLGLNTTTDSLGAFLLPKVPAGIWGLSFTRTGYADTSSQKLALSRKEAKTGIIAMMRRKPDTTVVVDTTGSFAGTVVDTAGSPLSAVSVLLVNGNGQVTLSDSTGHFLLAKVPADTWDLSFSRSGYAPKTLTGLVLARKEAKTGLIAMMRRKLDTAIAANRQVFGLLTDPTGIVRLEAIVTTKNGTTTLKDLTLGTNGAFAATLPLGSDSGSLKLIARDAAGHATGYSTVPFVAGGTAIQVPAFNPTNAIPKLEAGKDTTVPVGRIHQLKALARDTLDNAGIVSVEWSCGTATEWTVESKSGYNLVLPRDSGSLVCRVRATDLDSNVVKDSLELKVVNSAATTTGFVDVSVYTPTVSLSLQATDAEGVAKVLWDFGDGSTASTATGMNSAVTHTYAGKFPVTKPYTVTATVVDSMGGTTPLTKQVTIANGAASITGLNDTTIYTKTVTLSLKASDANGVAKVLWNFGDGTTDSTFTGTSSAVKHTYSGSFPKDSTFMIKVTVMDSLGGTTDVTKHVTIANIDAEISSPFDASPITPGDTAIFTVTVSDKNGVAKVLWIYGDGAIDTSISSGSITQKHVYLVSTAGTAGISGGFPFTVTVQDSLGDSTSKQLGVKTINNDIPTVIVNDTVGEVGTTLTLHAVGKDLGKITYEWSMDGTTFKVGAKDTTIALPATPNVNYPVYVRVKDEDGNVSKVDTIRIIVGEYITDSHDGQRYRITKIGTQTWMAQNLNYQVDSSWWYMNSADSGAKYGRLYTWASAMRLDDTCNTKSCATLVQAKHQGVCPSGWHVPTSSNWETLVVFLGGWTSAAEFMKYSNGWSSLGLKDLNGFSAIATRQLYLNTLASWWSSTETAPDASLFLGLDQTSKPLRTMTGKVQRFTLRCLKD